MFTLKEAKQEMENGFFPDVNPESDRFEELLGLLRDEEKDAFAEWVYEHCGKCYVGTRRVAGLRLADQRLEDFMRISSELIKSSDPYDRDSVFLALRQIDDPRRFEYLRVLLDDDYIQFSVIEYMYHYFPDEIMSKLNELENSSDTQVRNLAIERKQKFLRTHR